MLFLPDLLGVFLPYELASELLKSSVFLAVLPILPLILSLFEFKIYSSLMLTYQSVPGQIFNQLIKLKLD